MLQLWEARPFCCWVYRIQKIQREPQENDLFKRSYIFIISFCIFFVISSILFDNLWRGTLFMNSSKANSTNLMFCVSWFSFYHYIFCLILVLFVMNNTYNASNTFLEEEFLNIVGEVEYIPQLLQYSFNILELIL